MTHTTRTLSPRRASALLALDNVCEGMSTVGALAFGGSMAASLMLYVALVITNTGLAAILLIGTLGMLAASIVVLTIVLVLTITARLLNGRAATPLRR